MTHRRFLALLPLASLLASTVRADGLDLSIFSVSGFGTFGAVHSSEHDADFTSNVLKPNGAGYTHDWSFDVDSLVAGQLSFQPSSSFSAVVQVISEQLYDGSYRPHVEWANVSYRPVDDLTVRVGRIVLPAFMYSDTRQVGYALPWVRPPVEVYHLVPITNNDGIDASYRVHTGGLVQTFATSYGKSDPDLPPDVGGSAHGRQMWLLSDTLEYGAASAHIAYQSVELTVPAFDPLFDELADFGPAGVALADKYDVINKRARFYGFGAQYNPGSWFVIGEWGNVDYHSLLGETTAWYVSGGYRWGQVTPYLTYSDSRVISNTSDPGLPVAALPPALAPAAVQLNAGLDTLLENAADQRTLGAGARWDFHPNLALKFQFDHMRIGPDSHGTLINPQPGFRPGAVVNLISATIDFVW